MERRQAVSASCSGAIDFWTSRGCSTRKLFVQTSREDRNGVRNAYYTKLSDFGGRRLSTPGNKAGIYANLAHNDEWSNPTESFAHERTKSWAMRMTSNAGSSFTFATPLQRPAACAPSITGILTVWWFLDSVFLYPVYKGLAADVEVPGCASLVPITPTKSFQDELLLNRFQANALRR